MTTTRSTPSTDSGHDEQAVAVCACHLYDAECALHAAHQSGVEEWITAAADKLHQALGEYLASISAVQNREGRS